MEKGSDFLVIVGNPGTGKTHICSALVNWAYDNFNTLRYHREYDLLSKLRTSIDQGYGDYVKSLEFLIDDEVVMLDDVGSWWSRDKLSTKDNQWKIEIFFEFLDYRYNKQLPTIITSNLSKRDFIDIYSQRICSRLFSKQNTIIEMFGSMDIDKRTLGM